MWVLILKLRDILKKKDKGVNEEAIIHNSIYIFHSFRGHEKDLFHLNYNSLCIIYLHLFYYSKRF